MKATVLGLAVASVAFAGSTVYFWQQLKQEKTQAEQVAELNRQLNARVAELEKARAEFMARRTGGPFTVGALSSNGPVALAAPAFAPPSAESAAGPREFRMEPAGRRAEMPPAMLKMIRSQMRNQTKKTHFDLQEKLGLTDEQADKMLDLITEQQTLGMGARHEDDAEAFRAQMASQTERIQNEMAEVLGTKTAEYEEYQKSMPARMEVSMLAQQFESAEAPLTSAQRSRLVTAIGEERDRVPAPSYLSGTAPEQVQKEFAAWQEDYEQRVADRARAILNSDQLSVYNEYTQYQKEIREQMAAQGGNMLYRGPNSITAVGTSVVAVPGVRMRAVPPPPGVVLQQDVPEKK